MQTEALRNTVKLPDDSDLFEGMISVRAVFEGIDSGINNRKLSKLLFAESNVRGNGKLLGFLKARSFVYGYSLEVVPDSVIDSLAIGTSHGGVLLISGKRSYPEMFSNPPEKGFYFLMEGIEDPYNLGYAIRSVYAAGADGVILPKRNVMLSAGTVCRSSAGASELIPICCGETERIAAELKKSGYRLVCADMHAPEPTYRSDMKKPLVLAVGGEKRGFNKKLLEMSDLTVRLQYGRDFPMALSAASASAILAFEVTRQNIT